jgi:tetratricopeptide (TPR) repeat protein
MRAFWSVVLAVAIVVVGIVMFSMRWTHVQIARHLTAGQRLAIEGKGDEAIEEYGKALDMAVRAHDRESEGLAYFGIGTIDHQQERYEVARTRYNCALEAFQAKHDWSHIAKVTHELGGIASVLGEFDRAKELFNEALGYWDRASDESGRAASLHELGSVYMREDEPDTALAYLEDALTIRRRIGEKGPAAETLLAMGAVYHDELRAYIHLGLEIPILDIEPTDPVYVKIRELADKALEYYNEALTEFERLGDRPHIADTYAEIGSVYLVIYETDTAREYVMEAMERYEALKDEPGIGWCMHTMGSTYHRDGNAKMALYWYRDKKPDSALSLRERLGIRVGAAETTHEIGGVYQMTGDYPEAIKWYKKALKIRLEELDDQPRAAMTYYEMGQTYRLMGNATESRKCYEEALKRARDPEIHDLHLESACLRGLGLL